MPDPAIYYIHTGEWPSRSPSIVFVTGTALGLAAHGPAVLVVRDNGAGGTVEVFRSLTGMEPPPGLEVVRVGLGGKKPGHGALFREAVRLVGRAAREGRVRAVITRSIGFLPYLAFLRKRWRVPCLFEAHDFFGDPALRTDLDRGMRLRRNGMFERLSIPRLDGVICLTDTQAGLFRAAYPGTPVIVARTGLARVTTPPAPPSGTEFCYVGSLDRHKGLGTLLSALSLTADHGITLLVIGGKHEQEMRDFVEFANMFGVSDRVRISGWVHHSDIGSMMERCIAAVVPLEDTPFNRFITSPLKILDAFSLSLPVIASDLPSVREFIDDGVHGLLFGPGDPDSLAGALDRYVAGDMYGRMSAAVAERAAGFLWERRGAVIAGFVDSLAGKG